MSKAELIQDLIITLKNLPYREKERLEAFQKQMDCALSEILGPTSQAREDFRNIRFVPKSFYSTEEDYVQSWQTATSRVLALLECILTQLKPITVGLLPFLDSQRPTHTISRENCGDKKSTVPDPIILPAYLEKEPAIFDTTLRPDESISSPLLNQGKKNPLEKYLLELEFAPESETINIDEMQNWEGKDSSLAFKVPTDQSDLMAASENSTAQDSHLEFPTEKEESFSRLTHHEKSGKFAIFDVFKTGVSASAFARQKRKKQEISPAPSPPVLEEKSDKVEKSKIQQLESAIEKVKKSDLRVISSVMLSDLALPAQQSIKNYPEPSPLELSVFVTYGNNPAMKDDVLLTLQKLDLKVILPELIEQEGATLTKKFTDSTNIRFAMVILCGDDLGYKKDQGAGEAKLRSRQRVVFELGFLVGKLGRDRVFVLHQDLENFEFPTPFYDVLYTPYTNMSGWQLELLRHLKKAGYTVDANRLI